MARPPVNFSKVEPPNIWNDGLPWPFLSDASANCHEELSFSLFEKLLPIGLLSSLAGATVIAPTHPSSDQSLY